MFHLIDRIVETFLKYLEHEGHRITRAEFEENLAAKMEDEEFLADISPLLAPDTKGSRSRRPRRCRG